METDQLKAALEGGTPRRLCQGCEADIQYCLAGATYWGALAALGYFHPGYHWYLGRFVRKWSDISVSH